MPAHSWPAAVLAAFLAFTPTGFAQEKKDDKKDDGKPKVENETIQFESADAVQLQGTIYKPILVGKDKGQVSLANSEADAPVVILLHAFNANTMVEGWDSLAVTLARAGFHVLRYDFRGHGKSTVVSKDFWDDRVFPENSSVFSTKSRQKPLPLKLEPADLKAKPGYFPMLVNDIMAARVELDKRSDKGKLNTSTVYLIGAGDAATIGMLYMTAEWTRPQKPSQDLAALIKQLPFPNVPPRESAGKDIAGAVWLSPVRPAIVSERTMQDWVKSVSDLRESNAVLCLYGDQDATGKATSTAIVDKVLVANPTTKTLNKLPFTSAVPIKGGGKNVGIDLVKVPQTEKEILDFLGKIEKDRKFISPLTNRNYNIPPYISPKAFGLSVR